MKRVACKETGQWYEIFVFSKTKKQFSKIEIKRTFTHILSFN